MRSNPYEAGTIDADKFIFETSAFKKGFGYVLFNDTLSP